MRTSWVKLVVGMSLSLLFILPATADSMQSHQFTPDREGRSHTGMALGSEEHDGNVFECPPGNFQFRPGRPVFMQMINDDVNLPPQDTDVPTANNPLVPDVPTAPVPEPGTLLLIAPAALGLLNKFRR